MNNCPVCKTSEFQKIYFKLKNIDIFICEKCGLGSTLGESFLEPTKPDCEPSYFMKLRELLLSHEFGFLAKRGPLMLFEVGSGNGDLGNYLNSLGNMVTCSDIDLKSIKTIKKRFNIDAVHFDLLKSIPPNNKRYDGIILRHVFEHFGDPQVAINNLKSFLKPGGSVFILGPNLNSWSRYITRKTWTWTLPDHKFHWTEYSLRKFLQENNFIVTNVKGVYSPFGLPLGLGTLIKSQTARKLLFPTTFSFGTLLELIAIPFKRTNNIFIEAQLK